MHKDPCRPRRGIPGRRGVAFAILAIAAVTSVRDVRQANDTDRVAREWRQAMRTLGIDPVFPPSEDIHVGDLPAMDDQETDNGGSQSVLFRSIPIAHIAATEEVLRNTYKDIPRFPTDYDGTSPVEASAGIFDAPTAWKSLPIVAFPASQSRRRAPRPLAESYPGFTDFSAPLARHRRAYKSRFPRRRHMVSTRETP
jgi:hypothetical protein